MKRDALPATPIRYLSLFSGIEAATVAWAPLGWVCVGVAEIENFPCAVLAHHYPSVPNLGDITKITEANIAALGRIDVMVFGSPCQDMSVAGKRKGMLNADGTVTRSGLFFAAFNIFQWARKHGGCRFALWENVPGAYSSSQGRDFASVVELLAGLDDVAVPVNGWGTEGCALGDNGLLEWACLDAQWFGVAQRRRRVFAVLDTGDWSSRAPILLERQSMRGDFAPRRETGQDVAGTITSSLGRRCGQPDCGSTPGLLQPSVLLSARAGGAELAIDRSPTLTCNHEAPIVAGDLSAIASDSRQDCISSTEVFGALGSSSPQAQTIAYAIQAGALRTNPNSGPDGVGVQAHIAYTLEARAEVQAIAFSCKDHGADATIELAPTMRAMGHAASHANAGGQLAVCITGDATHCLKAEGFDASEDGTGRGQPIVASVSLRGREGGATAEMGGDLAGTLRASGGGGDKAHALIGMAVRRLTPTETERLQGFPDGYTAIPIKKYARKRVTKLRPESMWAQIDGNWWLLAADGPRYKSHGNSFAVPVINWIGRKIQSTMEAS